MFFNNFYFTDMDPKWNFISLGLLLTTSAACIKFLQKFHILPVSLKCTKCEQVMTKTQTFNGYSSFVCDNPKCRATRSIKSESILYGAQLTFRSFILLAYVVTTLSVLTYDNSKKTYDQTWIKLTFDFVHLQLSSSGSGLSQALSQALSLAPSLAPSGSLSLWLSLVLSGSHRLSQALTGSLRLSQALTLWLWLWLWAWS